MHTHKIDIHIHLVHVTDHVWMLYLCVCVCVCVCAMQLQLQYNGGGAERVTPRGQKEEQGANWHPCVPREVGKPAAGPPGPGGAQGRLSRVRTGTERVGGHSQGGRKRLSRRTKKERRTKKRGRAALPSACATVLRSWRRAETHCRRCAAATSSAARGRENTERREREERERERERE